jgi:hypothetical protein
MAPSFRLASWASKFGWRENVPTLDGRAESRSELFDSSLNTVDDGFFVVDIPLARNLTPCVVPDRPDPFG